MRNDLNGSFPAVFCVLADISTAPGGFHKRI
nr:MAG TPA: hypothetical protein [Caudoviricetes sp.]